MTSGRRLVYICVHTRGDNFGTATGFHSTLQGWKDDGAPDPSASVPLKVANVLEITVDWLLTGTEPGASENGQKVISFTQPPPSPEVAALLDQTRKILEACHPRLTPALVAVTESIAAVLDQPRPAPPREDEGGDFRQE